MSASARLATARARLADWLGIYPKPRRPVIERKRYRDLYTNPDTFAQFLRVRFQDRDSRVFVMDDERSCGIAIDINHITAQDRSMDEVMERHEKLLAVFENIPERDRHPYVVEFFSHSVPLLQLLHETLAYIDSHSGVDATDPLSVDYKAMLAEHFDDLAAPQGLFREGRYPWRGVKRRSLLLIYRTFDTKDGDLASNIREINDVAERIENGLNATGIDNRRLDENAYYQWLFPWFNGPINHEPADVHCQRHPYVAGENQRGAPDFEVDLLD